ncbi:unnamed protein product [Malus baccata var. baccata]
MHWLGVSCGVSCCDMLHFQITFQFPITEPIYFFFSIVVEMQGEGIRCLKLFHVSIFVVLTLLQYCNLSLSLEFNNISSRVVGHKHIAKVLKVIRCIEREREALLAIKQDLVDDYNSLSSWGSEAQKQDCCASWVGVYCDEYTGHVVKLDLSGGYFLGGRISGQVGNLTHLQYFDFNGNDFNNVENLNSWLPRLSSLTYLDLSYNNLSNVPDWLEIVSKLPKLTNLTLIGCGLSSPAIHSSTLFNINSSKSLAHVDLSFNQLTSSSIFVWLSNFSTSLVQLGLSRNNFTGSLPDVFGNMSSLAYLDLSYNQIEGGIPQSFSQLCSLQALLFRNNILSIQLSKLVQTLMSTCPDKNSLETLSLSNNSLSESIPNLKNFSYQKLGRIPASLARIDPFRFLGLSYNNFYEKIPIGTQLQNFDPSVLAGNPQHCGPPLQKMCADQQETVLSSDDEENNELITRGF